MDMRVEKQILEKVSHQIQSKSRGKNIVDNRILSISQAKLMNTIQRQSYRSAMELNTPVNSRIAVQMMLPVTPTRTVTNSMKTNMQASLARVFGGPSSRYQIDQSSGRTFNDGPPNYTIGHHGVTVTDTITGMIYSCDFHNNGRYYTRG